MIRARRAFLASAGMLAAGVLAGCATPARIDTSAPETVFQRTGRFAVSVQYANGQQEAVQGGFAWLDTGRLLTLDLANPLGSTLARVQVQPGIATLTRTDGQQQSAPNPDALVEQVLGRGTAGGCRQTAIRRDHACAAVRWAGRCAASPTCPDAPAWCHARNAATGTSRGARRLLRAGLLPFFPGVREPASAIVTQTR